MGGCRTAACCAMGRRKVKKAKRKSKKGREEVEVEGAMSEKPPSPSPQRFLIRVKLLDPVKDPEPPKQTDDCRLLPYAPPPPVVDSWILTEYSNRYPYIITDWIFEESINVYMRGVLPTKNVDALVRLVNRLKTLGFVRRDRLCKLLCDVIGNKEPATRVLDVMVKDFGKVDYLGLPINNCTATTYPSRAARNASRDRTAEKATPPAPPPAPAAALATAPPATAAAPSVPAPFNSTTLVHASKCTLGSECTFPDCSFHKRCAERLQAHKASCKNGPACKICRIGNLLESNKAKECATPQPVPISRQLKNALCNKSNAAKMFRAICRLTGQYSNGGVDSMAMRIQVEYEQQKLRNTVSTPMQSLIGLFLNNRPEFDRRVAAEVESYDKVQFEKDQARQQRHRQAQQEAQEREAAARQTIAVNAAAAAANAAAAAAVAAATVAAASFPTAPTLSAVSTMIPRCDFFARTRSMAMDDDEDDIEASNATISVTDPVSLTPITTPVKATGCKHNNCFDLESHKTRFYGRPNADWKCGICNAHAPLYELRIDAWTEALLAASSPDAKFVEYDTKTGAFVQALSEKANGKRKRSEAAIDVESIRAGSSSAPIEVDSD